MPVLLVVLLAGVLTWLWLARRNSSLTRLCRWREARSEGQGTWRCASCRAAVVMPAGRPPRQCLRQAAT